ncbi:MAG: cell division protein FtsA [Agitococcus sp.]|jgi:cell division protein FtsA|nr:cell division protein FtsA [Moraxellaceae bacterium]MBL0229884.1 cell division protein FtsA [Moraxellaceae bacterium]MBP9215719.1 cell division protein FtsA [Agitococcus sp.]MCC6373635.1 cell division protein FtsA [Moraxellaceae bacterium]HQV79944.1 cell division protein FtsA [Agitococcus sp.]
MVDTEKLIVALDVGTSKVVALIAQLTKEQQLEIIGVGKSACTGLKKGMVVDIEETSRAIQQAVKEAENMAHCQVHSVFIGIAGNHIVSRNLEGRVQIRSGEVNLQDMQAVLENAKTGSILPEQKILHILPQEFNVDNQYDIRNPMGMAGVRLEGHYHLVTCGLTPLQNLEKCIHACELGVDEVILEPYAAANAVLSEDEKTLGVCLIDIGAGTTDIAVYIHGALRYTEIIPVGGDHVTNDIAHVLRTPLADAEQLKIKQGCAQSIAVKREEYVQFPATNGKELRKLERHVLASIIEARYSELFEYINGQLTTLGALDYLSAGFVLTGGAARIEGAEALADSIFGKDKTRLGAPAISAELGGQLVQSSVYATGVGLLMAGREKHLKELEKQPVRRKGIDTDGFLAKLKAWLERNF